jgi:hypothetical protein
MSCRISERLLVGRIVPPAILQVPAVGAEVCTAVFRCHDGLHSLTPQ